MPAVNDDVVLNEYWRDRTPSHVAAPATMYDPVHIVMSTRAHELPEMCARLSMPVESGIAANVRITICQRTRTRRA